MRKAWCALQYLPWRSLHNASRNKPYGWFGAEACWTFDVHQRYVEARGIQRSLSSLLLVLVRSGWTHDGHWIRQRAIETRSKYCDYQYVSSGCVRRSGFQATASAAKPVREASSVASGSNVLHGRWWPI